jgi:hypothetical protein
MKCRTSAPVRRSRRFLPSVGTMWSRTTDSYLWYVVSRFSTLMIESQMLHVLGHGHRAVGDRDVLLVVRLQLALHVVEGLGGDVLALDPARRGVDVRRAHPVAVAGTRRASRRDRFACACDRMRTRGIATGPRGVCGDASEGPSSSGPGGQICTDEAADGWTRTTGAHGHFRRRTTATMSIFSSTYGDEETALAGATTDRKGIRSDSTIRLFRPSSSGWSLLHCRAPPVSTWRNL